MTNEELKQFKKQLTKIKNLPELYKIHKEHINNGSDKKVIFEIEYRILKIRGIV